MSGALAAGLPMVASALAENAGIVSAYVFGSQAAGRAHAESDIDIALLLDHRVYPTSRERFAARLDVSGVIARALRTNRLDLVILNDAPPGLGRQIVIGGRRIFCGNSERDHAFVRDVQLRAADLEPFLRRTRRVKLAAMERP